MTHSVGHSERSDAVVEPTLSKQWFVKMRPLADRVLENQKNKDTNSIYKIIKSDSEPAKLAMKDNYNEVISLITKYLESHGIYDMEVRQ